MRTASIARLVALAPLAVLVACHPESGRLPSEPGGGPSAMAFSSERTPWSAPVRLDAPVNSPTANDQGPALSPDDLSLYFCSDRPVGSGGNDLWVSRRISPDDAWGEPVNLGPGVNSPVGDCGPALSQDAILLFFTSRRTGGGDIYVTSRADPTDDLSWSAPVRLGPEINTAASEFSPFVTKRADDGTTELYFERGSTNFATDIFVVTIDGEGATLGPAVAVAEVNSSAADGRPTVRFDGREMLLHSNRDGREGNFDLFVSTRQSPNHPWSTPVPVDELNAPAPIHEIHPYLSRDGRTVVFVRGQGLVNDIWMATRTPSGQ